MYMTIRMILKAIRPHSKWKIDVYDRDVYDNDSNLTGSKIVFQAKRWDSDDLRYSSIAEFDTINEAYDFVRKYKSFPISADEVV